MRSPWLLVAPLIAPLLFIVPAEAQMVGPCCQRAEGDAHPDAERGPIFVPAEARRPEERALEAAAEAPIPVDVPLADAIGIPAEEQPARAAEPVREPERARIVDPPPMPVDPDGPTAPAGPIFLPPCCQAPGETHPPDRHPEDTPPILVGAKVRTRDERALEAAAEVPIPAQAPRVDAIGIPLEERPGVSEPAFVPVSSGNRPTLVAPERRPRSRQANAEPIIALFLVLLAIGFLLLRRRRRPRPELDPFAAPDSRPPLPEALLPPEAAPVPRFEPVTASAAKAAPARELEPA